MRITTHRLTRRLATAVTSLALLVPTFVGALTLAPARAEAATQPGYQTAQVEAGASTRTEPYFTYFGGQSTYWGYALVSPGSSWLQTVSVNCWWDGDWATGNYRTNRWFLVLVWESYDGYNVPRWLFVHASFVFNQPRVPQCYQTQTGIWGY